MERWMGFANADVAWVMKENLCKNRLSRIDPDWVEKWRRKLRSGKGGKR